MRGWAILYSNPNKATLNEAKALFERARALDPDNAPAMIGSARAWLVNMWGEDPASGIAGAEEAIDAALALQPDTSSAHEAKGWVFFAKRQFGSAIVEAEAAIAGDHNDADPYADAGFWKGWQTHARDAVPNIETALRLSPRDPMVPYWQWWLCNAYGYLGRRQKADELCNKAVAGGYRTRPASPPPTHWAGHNKEAKEGIAMLQKVDPKVTIQTFQAGADADENPTYKAEMARIIEGLHKAGLTEGQRKTN